MAPKQSKHQPVIGTDIVCPMHEGLEEKFNTFSERFETVLTKIDGLDKHIIAQFQYLDEKTSSAKTDMERRLEGMNEFRAQLAKQAAEFITRQELTLMFEKVGLRIDQLTDKLGVNREILSTNVGKRAMSDKIVVGFMVLGSSMITGTIILALQAIFKHL